MDITKDNAMLIDVQYMKANRKEKIPDYLYIIWKDLDTGEKHLKIVEEPKMTIYFEKPEFRDHTNWNNYKELEKCDAKTVKYKDIMYAIADDWGEEGRQFIQNCFETRQFGKLNEIFLYPYSFGADYDIRVWYRYNWKKTFSNDRPKTLTKGFLDIEVDVLEAVGLPNPNFNPIDLCTIIDNSTNKSYTFALIGVDYKPSHSYIEYNKEHENDVTRNQTYFDRAENKKKDMYAHRMKEQDYWSTHVEELKEKAHEMFDDAYPGMDYNFYFYKDELKMITHIWQLINTLKLDFIEIWNMPFDMPYFHDRIMALGASPENIMCHPDFPVKECWFKPDKRHFEIKNKTYYFNISSYTVFPCQMTNYAAIRKGGSELRSNRLDYIGKKEVGDTKLNYSAEGNIKTLSYKNYLMYILYNIKDVLLQMKIERRTSDLDTYWTSSYENMTAYEDVFKQTVVLRNVQYESFMQQNLVPGNNVNAIYMRTKNKGNDLDDVNENNEDEDDVGFEGALVGNPRLIMNFGMEIFGKKSNSVFQYSIDLDMSAFYPSTIEAMNIDPSCLIFKCIVPSNQFNVRGGKLKYNGITDVQMCKDNKDTFGDDVSKEIMDNFQTKNYISFAHKWLNFPSINQVYERLMRDYG